VFSSLILDLEPLSNSPENVWFVIAFECAAVDKVDLNTEAGKRAIEK
jgi:hypothetical protein